METLTLKSLHFHASHGYYKEERINGNDFEVDIIISAPLRRAGQTDKLEDSIDYKNVQNIAAAVMDGPPIKLIETLARKIGDTLFKELPEAEQLEVAVRKLSPPLDINTDYSEIRMSWQR